MRRLITVASLAVALLVSIPVAAAAHAEFDGSFSEVRSDGEGCQSIFQVTDYHAKHFLVGPTGRTSVLNFTDKDAEGFFNGISFIGNYGGSGDIYYDKRMTTDAWTYDVHAEGLLDRNVTIIDFSVFGNGPAGATCTASATYGGFN